jgi:hypothetical protein
MGATTVTQKRNEIKKFGKSLCTRSKLRGDASNLRGDLFQADDAGERADFLLLVLAQLE